MSPDPDRASFADLLESIFALQVRVCELLGYRRVPRRGPPASEEQIRSAEHACQCLMPSSYRQYLSIQNGCEYWNAGLALLSTDEMMEPRYIEYIENWRKDYLDLESDLIRTALVIGLAFDSATFVFIDFTSPTKQEIVLWEYQEISRYPDFYHYLLSFKEILARFISELEAQN